MFSFLEEMSIAYFISAWALHCSFYCDGQCEGLLVWNGWLYESTLFCISPNMVKIFLAAAITKDKQ